MSDIPITLSTLLNATTGAVDAGYTQNTSPSSINATQLKANIVALVTSGLSVLLPGGLSVIVGTAGQGAAGVGLGISLGGVFTGATAADRLSAALSALGAVAGVVASTPLVPPQARLGALLAQGLLTAISGAISRDPAFINNLISDLTRASAWIDEGVAAVAVATNTITGDQAQPDHFDVLYGSGAGDDITGLDGNDALNGGTGTDVIGGGVGDDLIGGGAGSDVIKGGAGNDWIFSAVDLTAPACTGSSDVWPPIGQPLPPTATIIIQGKTWGVYYDIVNGKPVTYVNGIAVSTPDIAPDVIDGGEGDDQVQRNTTRRRYDFGACINPSGRTRKRHSTRILKKECAK